MNRTEMKLKRTNDSDLLPSYMREYVRALRVKCMLSENTIAHYRSQIKNLIISRKVNDYHDLTLDDYKERLSEMVDKRYSKETIRVYVSACKIFYLEILKITIPSGELPRIKMDKKCIDYVTPREMYLIYTGINNSAYGAILLLCYECGLRISEACNLHIECIISNEEEMKIKVHEAKGNKQRFTVLTKTTLRVLRNYYKEKHYEKRPTTGPIFLTRFGNTIEPKKVNRALINTLRDIGITKAITPHKLRHAFAKNMEAAGCDLHVLMKMLGHSNVNTTILYLSRSVKSYNMKESEMDRYFRENVHD